MTAGHVPLVLLAAFLPRPRRPPPPRRRNEKIAPLSRFHGHATASGDSRQESGHFKLEVSGSASEHGRGGKLAAMRKATKTRPAPATSSRYRHRPRTAACSSSAQATTTATRHLAHADCKPTCAPIKDLMFLVDDTSVTRASQRSEFADRALRASSAPFVLALLAGPQPQRPPEDNRDADAFPGVHSQADAGTDRHPQGKEGDQLRLEAVRLVPATVSGVAKLKGGDYESAEDETASPTWQTSSVIPPRTAASSSSGSRPTTQNGRRCWRSIARQPARPSRT